MFDEDLDDFLDDDGWASVCTLPAGDVKAIYEVAWVEITIGKTPYSGERPTLYGKESDFDGTFGNTVTVEHKVDGVVTKTDYTILDIRPEGSGMSRIILQGQ